MRGRISVRAAAWTAAAVLAAGGVTGVAVAATGGSAAASPVAATGAAAHRMHWGHGRLRLGNIARHVLHGTFVVQTRRGFRTVDVQRGQVMSVVGDVVTVRSADNYSAAYTVTATSRIRARGRGGSVADVHRGDRVLVVATPAGAVADVLLLRVVPAAAAWAGA